MYRQQTIVMSIDKGRVFEEKKEDGSYFTSTDFDEKVEEFFQTLIENGSLPLTVLNQATNDYLIAIIQYDDEPQKQNNSGILKAVPDVNNLNIPG